MNACWLLEAGVMERLEKVRREASPALLEMAARWEQAEAERQSRWAAPVARGVVPEDTQRGPGEADSPAHASDRNGAPTGDLGDQVVALLRGRRQGVDAGAPSETEPPAVERSGRAAPGDLGDQVVARLRQRPAGAEWVRP